jgi:hypothetical protein
MFYLLYKIGAKEFLLIQRNIKKLLEAFIAKLKELKTSLWIKEISFILIHCTISM